MQWFAPRRLLCPVCLECTKECSIVSMAGCDQATTKLFSDSSSNWHYLRSENILVLAILHTHWTQDARQDASRDLSENWKLAENVVSPVTTRISLAIIRNYETTVPFIGESSCESKRSKLKGPTQPVVLINAQYKQTVEGHWILFYTALQWTALIRRWRSLVYW